MSREEASPVRPKETDSSVLRARKALAEAFGSSGPMGIKGTLVEMADRLKKGDKKGVVNILESYYSRLRGPIPDYGLLIFGEYIPDKGRPRRIWYLYSPSFGIQKREYVGDSDNLDFGRGPILSHPPDSLSDKEFNRAAFIGLGTMLYWIGREQRGY